MCVNLKTPVVKVNKERNGTEQSSHRTRCFLGEEQLLFDFSKVSILQYNLLHLKMWSLLRKGSANIYLKLTLYLPFFQKYKKIVFMISISKRSLVLGLD